MFNPFLQHIGETFPTTQPRALTLPRVATVHDEDTCGGIAHDNRRQDLIIGLVDRNSYLGVIPWWEALEQHRQFLAVG